MQDSALRALHEAHDYFTYTQGAWRTLDNLIQRGDVDFTFQNPHTGSSISARDLLLRSQGYVSRELTSATLQQFVAIFEGFLNDVLRLWLLAHPQALSSRQLSGRDILSLPDKPAIVDALVDKGTEGRLLRSSHQLVSVLRTRMGADPPVDDQLLFAELKATRDVLVHGHGIANAYYVDKAGSRARARAGQTLVLSEDYHRDCWSLVCRMVDHIGSTMGART